jgi:hypothetical protein
MRAAAVLVAVGAVASLAAPPPGSPADEVRCDYRSKIECSALGCAPVAIDGGYLRLPDAATLVRATARATDAASLPTIQLCHAKACTPIRVRAATSGAFVNIAQDGGAHFIKVATRDVGTGLHRGEFVEVAARFLTTVTFVGSCPALVR